MNAALARFLIHSSRRHRIWQVAVAIGLGVFCGFLSSSILLFMLLLACAYFAPIHLPVFLIAATLCSLGSTSLAKFFGSIGLESLRHRRLSAFWMHVESFPLVPWLDLHHPVVNGSLIVGSFAGLMALIVSYVSLKTWTAYRQLLADTSEASKFAESNVFSDGQEPQSAAIPNSEADSFVDLESLDFTPSELLEELQTVTPGERSPNLIDPSTVRQPLASYDPSDDDRSIIFEVDNSVAEQGLSPDEDPEFSDGAFDSQSDALHLATDRLEELVEQRRGQLPQQATDSASVARRAAAMTEAVDDLLAAYADDSAANSDVTASADVDNEPAGEPKASAPNLDIDRDSAEGETAAVPQQKDESHQQTRVGSQHTDSSSDSKDATGEAIHRIRQNHTEPDTDSLEEARRRSQRTDVPVSTQSTGGPRVVLPGREQLDTFQEPSTPVAGAMVGADRGHDEALHHLLRHLKDIRDRIENEC